jgi:hypothetical protein
MAKKSKYDDFLFRNLFFLNKISVDSEKQDCCKTEKIVTRKSLKKILP